MPRLDWDSDVRPILVAVKQAADESDDILHRLDSRAVEAAAGREAGDLATFAALDALSGAGYVEGVAGFGDPPTWMFIKLTEKGRQEVSGWPVTPGADYGAQFIEELDRRIEDAPDDQERTRLERFREAAGEIGKGVITGVLTNMARGL
jgi:hypothetical protein